MKLSIVSTLYRSDLSIHEFYERSSEEARRFAGDDYEIVFVNDGSPDESLEIAVSLSNKDPHVVVIDLSRNFGHHKAMMTGLGHALGRHIFLIDSDLEERPEWLTIFQSKLTDNPGTDVVFGVQQRRKGGAFERVSGSLFWYMISRLSGLSLTANIVTARLMTRRYVDALLMHDEREVFMAGLWNITGYKQMPVNVEKIDKKSSTYTLARKVSLLVNSVTSFSAFPLLAIFYAGIAIFFFALLYTLFLVVNWLVFAKTMAGWTSVMVSIWLIGGMILSSMGVLGIYIAKVFSESKRRPYTIVREIYGR